MFSMGELLCNHKQKNKPTISATTDRGVMFRDCKFEYKSICRETTFRPFLFSSENIVFQREIYNINCTSIHL